MVRLLLEERSSELVNEELALEAARKAFLAAVTGATFPVVIGHSADPGTRFTLKSGAMRDAVGVKIGSYWPGNDALGLPRHGSTIILLDEATGRLAAVVEAATANAYRTAAADAIAVSVLARPDAEVLTVLGTGHQALFEARALVQVRPIRQVLVAGRDLGKAGLLAQAITADTGIEAQPVDVRTACQRADLLVRRPDTAVRRMLGSTRHARLGDGHQRRRQTGASARLVRQVVAVLRSDRAVSRHR